MQFVSAESVMRDTLTKRRKKMKNQKERSEESIAISIGSYYPTHVPRDLWLVQIVEWLEEPGRCGVDQTDEGGVRYVRHCLSLTGPRKRGSTTARGLDFLPINSRLRDVTNHYRGLELAQEGCSYYELTIPKEFREEMQARIGVIKLRDLLELESSGRANVGPLVELRDAGTHGIDIVFQCHEDHASNFFEETDILTFITGPKPEEMWSSNNDMTQDHEEILYTWHPGPVMSRGTNELTMDSMIKLEVMKND